jgi:hypothetical protein
LWDQELDKWGAKKIAGQVSGVGCQAKLLRADFLGPVPWLGYQISQAFEISLLMPVTFDL